MNFENFGQSTKVAKETFPFPLYELMFAQDPGAGLATTFGGGGFLGGDLQHRMGLKEPAAGEGPGFL